MSNLCNESKNEFASTRLRDAFAKVSGVSAATAVAIGNAVTIVGGTNHTAQGFLTMALAGATAVTASAIIGRATYRAVRGKTGP